jgi:transcriptional regulator with XRE-family HTH domain
MLMTGNQLKAARALAGVDQLSVARAANVAVNTIRNMESRGPDPITSGAVTLRNVQSALEAAGVEFTNGDQPGVRIKSYRLKDAGHEAFPVDLDFIGVGVIDAKRNITIRVERSALDHLGDRRIGAGGDHMRAFDEHRDRIIRIADEKYKRGIIEPDDIVLVMYADVANR